MPTPSKIALPAGVYAWGQLDDLECVWPWPYSEREATAIGDLLPEAARVEALRAVVQTVRRYLLSLVAKRQNPRKENPRKEVERTAAAIDELIAALEGLGVEATNFLRSNAVAIVAREASVCRILEAAYAFRDFNRGLDKLATDGMEQVELRGRMGGTEGFLQSRLELIFLDAHEGRKPRSGWTAFRDACFAPLRAHGAIPVVEPKTKQDQLRRAKSPRKDVKSPLFLRSRRAGK